MTKGKSYGILHVRDCRMVSGRRTGNRQAGGRAVFGMDVRPDMKEYKR